MARASSASSPQREQVTKLVCVRHGETDLNSSHIIQGRMDTNLNQIGRRQAAMVYIYALSLSLYIYISIYIYFVIEIIYGRLHCDSDLLICYHPQGCSSSVRRSRASGHLLLRHEACSPDCASHRNSVWFSCMYQTFILQLQHLEYITISR
jgi:hypothetical protein